MARFRDERVSDDDLTKAKRRHRGDIEAGYDDIDGLCGWYGGTEFFYARPRTQEPSAKRASCSTPCTAEKIHRAVRRVLRPERLDAWRRWARWTARSRARSRRSQASKTAERDPSRFSVVASCACRYFGAADALGVAGLGLRLRAVGFIGESGALTSKPATSSCSASDLVDRLAGAAPGTSRTWPAAVMVFLPAAASAAQLRRMSKRALCLVDSARIGAASASPWATVTPGVARLQRHGDCSIFVDVPAVLAGPWSSIRSAGDAGGRPRARSCGSRKWGRRRTRPGRCR